MSASLGYKSKCLHSGGRPASSHISLDHNSRLADAFAIYGVPRGITQYMSRKWSSGSPRGASIPLDSPIRRSSSSGQQQLQEKLVAVRKASHVILLEAMQLRWDPCLNFDICWKKYLLLFACYSSSLRQLMLMSAGVHVGSWSVFVIV